MGVLRAMAAVRQFAANSLSEPTFPSEQLQQLAGHGAVLRLPRFYDGDRARQHRALAGADSPGHLLDLHFLPGFAPARCRIQHLGFLIGVHAQLSTNPSPIVCARHPAGASQIMRTSRALASFAGPGRRPSGQS